jgi:hypothetical protein
MGKARTHCMGAPNLFSGWETVWPHHAEFPATGHRSLTFTTMGCLNGPGKPGEYGSSVAVIRKQRPQASPKLVPAPNARSLAAAVNPDDITPPQAEEGRQAQHGLREGPNHNK